MRGGAGTSARWDPSDCRYRLSIDVASEREARRTERSVAYANLSAGAKAAFLDARRNGSADLGKRLPDQWSSPVIVRYDGTAYYAVVSTC